MTDLENRLMRLEGRNQFLEMHLKSLHQRTSAVEKQNEDLQNYVANKIKVLRKKKTNLRKSMGELDEENQERCGGRIEVVEEEGSANVDTGLMKRIDDLKSRLNRLKVLESKYKMLTLKNKYGDDNDDNDYHLHHDINSPSLSLFLIVVVLIIIIIIIIIIVIVVVVVVVVIIIIIIIIIIIVWLSAIHRSEIVSAVFLDLNLVDHTILQQKLKVYLKNPSVIPFFHSYLSYRLQYACVNGKLSSIGAIQTGVPQGNLLGPL